jgi:hypothetical protein
LVEIGQFENYQGMILKAVFDVEMSLVEYHYPEVYRGKCWLN